MKVEIGPGKERLGPDWVTADIPERQAQEPKLIDRCANWGFEELPFANDSIDLFYSSHVIEHIPWFRVSLALKEAFRVMKSGATFEAHTIDFAKCLEAYQQNKAPDGWKARGHNPDSHPFKWVVSRLFSVGPGELWHKGTFDEPYLRGLLKNAGFTDIEKIGKPRGHDHGFVNLGMRCRKP